MTGSEVAAIITSLATLIVAITGMVASIAALRKIEEVRHATNSLTDRLVETTAKSSKAIGVKEERERQEGGG